ncbi:DUF3813 domain-containing protein [Pradoshia eiseniae]|uniref:DUF3813 domain-containing protein n=1 Tax=Pradoshia eiseniae TaxID=2064768 RepID=A0A2S7N0A4_9BACI|nr:DUF3813 domain-containing protein [Pradoshia eiseniae]PQD95443.1 DUF3813 domain-containing protein [Pradoshia eiseniae]
MRNELFGRAKKAVELASSSNGSPELIAKARNELSSAFANSTIAEQAQLHQMQDLLDSLENSIQ